MTGTLIRAQGLVKQYRKGSELIRPVDGLDLDVGAGELVSIRGPSGCGKSTLLHLLGGLDRADAGSVEVAGISLAKLREAELCRFRNTHVGFVFQVFHLVPVLSALENVELPLRLTRLSAARRREQAELALDLVGLKDRLSHRPDELSGGQQQRVAIARAIAADPELILADEPTGDLDEKTGDEIMELFIALNEQHKKTIVMVTHDVDKARRAARQLVYSHGKVTDAVAAGASARPAAARAPA